MYSSPQAGNTFNYEVCYRGVIEFISIKVKKREIRIIHMGKILCPNMILIVYRKYTRNIYFFLNE